MLRGFKEAPMRGNVMETAEGVIILGSFATIVN